jgi:hypothetical protein
MGQDQTMVVQTKAVQSFHVRSNLPVTLLASPGTNQSVRVQVDLNVNQAEKLLVNLKDSSKGNPKDNLRASLKVNRGVSHGANPLVNQEDNHQGNHGPLKRNLLDSIQMAPKRALPRDFHAGRNLLSVEGVITPSSTTRLPSHSRFDDLPDADLLPHRP